MDESEFWKIIENSRKGIKPPDDNNKQYDALKEILYQYDPKQIVSFYLIWHKKWNKLFRWDVRAVEAIMEGSHLR